jgi:hypothetical protein
MPVECVARLIVVCFWNLHHKYTKIDETSERQIMKPYRSLYSRFRLSMMSLYWTVGGLQLYYTKHCSNGTLSAEFPLVFCTWILCKTRLCWRFYWICMA